MVSIEDIAAVPLGPASDAAEPLPWTGRRWLRRLRMAAWPAYLIVFGWFLFTDGVPLENDVILAWLIGALLTAAAANGGNPLRVLRDWLPVAVALYTYSLLRGYAGHPWFKIHWGPQVRIDKALGLGVTWTNRLQYHFLDPAHPHWWDYAAWGVYMTHFFTIFIVLAVLWRRRYQRFQHLLACYGVLTFAGYATYVLYPADPPWIAGQDGHLPAVGRLIGPMFDHIGLPLAQAVFERGSSFDNDVAAMPSLHSAYPALLLLFFWPVANKWIRALLVAYPLAMATTLVYSGEHFVVDILAGWTYAAVAYFGVTRLLRWWSGRADRNGSPAVTAAMADAVA
ncbi:MAG: inositol phosphorylceramide synthase [Catenulisporales bacterium]|nr:inositol phosphorylceramide synthase [Catenulisporales bacterium]